jgi:hypothetical protein
MQLFAAQSPAPGINAGHLRDHLAATGLEAVTVFCIALFKVGRKARRTGVVAGPFPRFNAVFQLDACYFVAMPAVFIIDLTSFLHSALFCWHCIIQSFPYWVAGGSSMYSVLYMGPQALNIKESKMTRSRCNSPACHRLRIGCFFSRSFITPPLIYQFAWSLSVIRSYRALLVSRTT